MGLLISWKTILKSINGDLMVIYGDLLLISWKK